MSAPAAGAGNTTAVTPPPSAAAKTPDAAAAPPRPKRSRLMELDALRALMMLVIAFHAFQASQGEYDLLVWREYSAGGILLGNIDVLLPTFFVLSGFALYYQFGAMVLMGRDLPGSREWLVQRALRLLPVYFVMFLLVWVWRYGGGAQQWEDLFVGMALVQTWSTDHIFRTIDPGWYLSVEWQFALVVALLVMPWMRMISGWPQRSRLAGLLMPPAAFIVLTLWWRLSLRDARVPGDHWGAWFAPPNWTLMYGVGMLLGLALVLKPAEQWRLPRPAPTLIFIAGTAWMLVLQIQRGQHEFLTLWYFHLATIGVLCWLLAAITADPDGRVRRSLRNPVVQALAAASFVTYIIHAPILRSLAARNILPMDNPAMWPASMVAIVLISLGLGYLVHRYLEGPLTSLEKLLVPKVTRVSKVLRAKAATVAIADRLPDVPVRDLAGAVHLLPQLGEGRPVLLLIHPTGHIPREPSMQGSGAARRALDDARAGAAAAGVRLAVMTPDPPPHPFAEVDDGVEPILELVDPGSVIAAQIGVATARTGGGVTLPELVLLAVDHDGRVVDVIRERDAHAMLHRGMSCLGDVPEPARRFQRGASITGQSGASTSPVLRPEPGAA